jgi:pimeloyl-ACP methyl ester carboxylesterase
MPPRYFAHLALLCALLCALLPAAPARAARPAPQRGGFSSASCPVKLPAGAQEGRDIECGYLTVPEQHSQPGGKTIQLAVAVIKSRSASPAPDPLVMMQGGPGGSTLDLFVPLLLGGSELRADRDIVLFDQRGTLYSKPKLACSEQIELVERTIEQRLSHEESQRLGLEAERACRDRLAKEGVNFSAYDTEESAADVDALRRALGYDQINLYGVSYGTLLALTVMRSYPEGLRSVILDGVVPPQLDTSVEVAQTVDRALGELFAACAADPACAASYPDLERVFFETIDALNKTPARVPLTDPETRKTYSAVIDGDSLFDTVFQFLYQTDLLPALPQVIYAARAGDFGLIQRILPQIAFDRTFSLGMYRTVNCAAEPGFKADEIKLDGVRPKVAEWAKRSGDFEERACAPWGVDPLPASAHQPVSSDVPTLLLSGRFDPVTPARFAEQVARTLPRSYSFTFGHSGHGAALAGECPVGIIQSFLDDPDAQPDARCIQRQPAPEFLTPRGVRMSPVVRSIIEMLETSSFGPLIVLALAAVVLLSLFLVWPLAWLVQQIRQGPAADRPRWSRLMRLLALLTGPLALVFAVGLVLLIAQNETARPALLLLGVPRTPTVTALFAIPLLIALIALAMLAWSIWLWTRRSWTLGWRIYFSLLTLAALLMVASLAPLDAFGVLLL